LTAVGIVFIVAFTLVAPFAGVKTFELSLRSLGFPFLLFPFCSMWVWEAGQKRADEEIYCDGLVITLADMERWIKAANTYSSGHDRYLLQQVEPFPLRRGRHGEILVGKTVESNVARLESNVGLVVLLQRPPHLKCSCGGCAWVPACLYEGAGKNYRHGFDKQHGVSELTYIVCAWSDILDPLENIT
jgi:hypothetical protein